MSYIFSNDALPLLVALGALISTFAFSFPANNKRSNKYTFKFKVAIFVAISLGLILGILKTMAFVIPNNYLQYGMYYLSLRSLVSSVDKYVLIPLGTTVLFFIGLYAVKALLRFTGLSKRTSDFLVYGIAPSTSVFIIGGYLINRKYLPGFFDLKSIVANLLWAAVCVLLVWVLGLLILKVSHRRINFPKIMPGARTLICLVGLVVLLNLAYFVYSQSVKSDRPNLILISIDTLRADHLSCYGYDRNTSPNIDRFARDGVLFTNTIAQSSWTLPSHMSMLTGLYPSGHGVLSKHNKLGDEHLTVAEILQNAGYETAAITDRVYLSQRYGYQGFDFYHDKGCLKCRGAIKKTYKRAVKWLRKGHSRPFFLFLHTYQVHAPYDPLPDYDIYSDKSYRGITYGYVKYAHYGKIEDKFGLEDYLYLIDKYDGEIFYADHFLGKLFKKLKQLGLYNNSIIILTSDHGENFLDHKAHGVGHGELYDEIVKVPLIIKAPMFPTNKIVEAQVESIDIVPTVLELLDISIPVRVDGESLVELVKLGSYDSVFAFSQKDHEYKMIRSKDWKLLQRSQSEFELFDLIKDPKEQLNIFAQETEVAKSLFEALNIWSDTQKQLSKSNSTDNKIELDKELTDQLKALGYIN